MKRTRYDPGRGTLRATPFFLPLFLLLLFVFSSNNTTAEARETLYSLQARQFEDTNVVYTGELGIKLHTRHQSNGTGYRMDAESEIFQSSPNVRYSNRISEGAGGWHSMNLRTDIEPGNYEVAIRSNFTDEKGNNVSFFKSIPVEVIRVISLDYVQPPSNGSMWFSLGVTTFHNIDRIWVRFTARDGIEAERRELELVNVAPGHHVFRTKIRPAPLIPGITINTTVGYYLRARYNGRSVPFGEPYIPVTITWDDEVEDDRIVTIPHLPNTFFIVVLVSFLVAFNYYWYFTPKTGREQRSRYGGKRDKDHPVSDGADPTGERGKPKN